MLSGQADSTFHSFVIVRLKLQPCQSVLPVCAGVESILMQTLYFIVSASRHDTAKKTSFNSSFDIERNEFQNLRIFKVGANNTYMYYPPAMISLPRNESAELSLPMHGQAGLGCTQDLILFNHSPTIDLRMKTSLPFFQIETKTLH